MYILLSLSECNMVLFSSDPDIFYSEQCMHLKAGFYYSTPITVTYIHKTLSNELKYKPLIGKSDL